MACDDNARAARDTAMLDYLHGVDNGKAVEEALPETAQLHYATYKAGLENEGQVLGPVEFVKGHQPVMKGQLEDIQSGIGKHIAWNFMTGDIPAINVSMDRIIGDDIVRPVEDAYNRYHDLVFGDKDLITQLDKKKILDPDTYTEGEIADKLEDYRVQSGLYDALEDAHDAIEEKFGDGQDPKRYKAGINWVMDVERPNHIQDPFVDEIVSTIEKGSGNIVRNLLQNDLVGAARNYFDRFRALYQFGPSHYLAAREQFSKVLKDKNSPLYKEMQEAGVFGNRVYESKGPDIYTASEPGNKGITYLAAKRFALKKGMSKGDAKIFARKSVEQLQYQYSYVNKPPMFRNRVMNSYLKLMSFALGERRFYNSLWKGAIFSKGNQGHYIKALAYYTAAQAIIYGPSAMFPEELWQPLKYFFPEMAKAIRGVDRYSILSGLGTGHGVDLANYSRPVITPYGLLFKTPVIIQKLADIWNDGNYVIQHPDKTHAYLKLFKDSIMLAPPGANMPGLKFVSNRTIGNTVEFLYRAIFGDYKRHHSGKEYYTNLAEEAGNVARGGRESFDRKQQEEASQGSSKIRHLHLARPKRPNRPKLSQ